MSELKLIALDAEDLQILSAHLQDAVGRAGDIAYEPGARRFAMVLNRFDWASIDKAAKQSPGRRGGATNYARCQTALRFEKVLRARSVGIDRSRKQEVMSLLAISFEEAEAPSGTITLYFSGGPKIALDVEYIEAELRDLGAAWTTTNRPIHPDGEAGEESG